MELEVDSRFWPKERVETLSHIIYQIFEEHIRFEQFKDCRPINEIQKLLLIKKILERRGMQSDGLTYFSPLLSNSSREESDFSGIYRSISRFFSLLVRNNLQDRFVEDLGDRIIRLEQQHPGAGEERYALESDLIWLFADFEEIKREIKGFDEDNILASVSAYLKNGGEPDFLADIGALVLDGFIHISRVEEDILFSLCHQFGDIWWLLDYDSQTKDPIRDFKEVVGREAGLFWKGRHTGETEKKLGRYEAYRIFTPLVSLMHRLEGVGFKSEIERATDETVCHPMAGLYIHGHVEEAPNEGLKVKAFANKVDEVRAIAGEIKKMIHEKGLNEPQDLGRFRVIFPDLNDYSSLISEIFTLYKVPFSLTKGLALSLHPITYIFRYIFEIPLNHFRTDDLFHLFSSPLIRTDALTRLPCTNRLSTLRKEYFLAEESGTEFSHRGTGENTDLTLDIFLFDQVARKCGLNRLGTNFSRLWEEGLLKVRDYYQTQLSLIKPPEKRADILSEYYRFLYQVKLLERFLTFFKNLGNGRHPQDIVEGVFRILDLLGFPENMVQRPRKEIAPESAMTRMMIKRDIKAYTLLKDLVLRSAKEVKLAKELFGIGEGDLLLSKYYSVFKSGLSQTYLLDARDPNVIRVSEWLEIRGRSFDYVFAGGLIADKFPLKEPVDFLLPEAPNKMFRMRDPIDQSKYLFSHLLRNCRNRLYLSFPRYSNEKEARPSPMLYDLKSILSSSFALGGRNTLEEIFPWEENPYFVSEEELLDGTCVKKPHLDRMREDLFPLKRIILKYETFSNRLLRAINALRSRLAEDGLFEYDGLVEASDRFKEYSRNKSNFSSASRLETLANCPMRYLFEHVYGLRTLEEQGLEASNRELGEHIHAILRRFYERLRHEKKNVADIGINLAFSLIKEIAVDYFTALPFLNKLDFFEFQYREFLAGLEQDKFEVNERMKERKGVLAQLLRFEETAFRDRFPGGVEYKFGHRKEAPVLLGKTKIRGYVDRFDIMKGDEDKIYIYDYKTGNIPPSDMVKRGLAFQLPAYIYALKTELQFKEFSAFFYALKRDVFLKENPLKQAVNDNCKETQGLDLSGVRLIDEYADRLMELVKKGYFHHSADGLRCRFCEFRYACYRNMRRMDHLVSSNEGRRIYSGKENFREWKKVDEFHKGWKGINKSMQRAFNLKTVSGRKRHFDTVIEYRKWLRKNGDCLPFYGEYIEELIQKINEFEKAHLQN
jgi:RecB family exonuclease